MGSAIGGWPTIGLVVLTAIIGAALIRTQGPSTLMRAKQKMGHGELPTQELQEGVLIIIGGTLLLTPGFMTDTLGLIALVPLTRKALMNWVLPNIKQYQSPNPHTPFEKSPHNPFKPQQNQEAPNTIDGEFEREKSDH